MSGKIAIHKTGESNHEEVGNININLQPVIQAIYVKQIRKRLHSHLKYRDQGEIGG